MKMNILLIQSCPLVTNFLLISSFLVIVTSTQRIAAAETGSALPSSIQTASELKVLAEEWAKILKQAYDKKKVSDNDFLEARSYYIDAQAAVKGWLNRLQGELEAGRDPKKSERYDQALQAASARSDTFIRYSKALLFDTDRGMVSIKEILDAFKILADAGIEIWKEWRSTQKGQKEALIKRLEDLKWRPFEEI